MELVRKRWEDGMTLTLLVSHSFVWISVAPRARIDNPVPFLRRLTAILQHFLLLCGLFINELFSFQIFGYFSEIFRLLISSVIPS